MKRPEYCLRVPVKIVVQNNMDDIEYPAGTLVFPFWNETLLPDHRRVQLKEAEKLYSSQLIMCIIGVQWVPVTIENIRKN
jgi:hypothetical protein